MRDIIILDTSIFIKENFLHGNKIKGLLNLSKKGEIDLYITEITYQEILANFAKSIGLALSEKRKFEKDHKVLRNNDSFDIFFSKFEKNELIESFKKEIDELINESIIKKIPYTSLNIGDVFKKYFNTAPPFSNGSKKAEFPDAFSIELIKKYFEGLQLTTPIKVFSTDKDFLNYNENDLSFSDNYVDYINNINLNLLLQKKKIIIQKMFEDNENEFRDEFRDWFNDYLHDDTLYYNVFLTEIYMINIENIEIENLKYNIISIANNYVTIEVLSDVSVSIKLLVDNEDKIVYDEESRIYYCWDTETKTIKKTFCSKMIVDADIFVEYDDYDFKIKSINEDLTLDFNT